jgi:hypothetical protein
MAMGRNSSGSAVPNPHPPTVTLPAKNPYLHAGSSSYPYPYLRGFFTRRVTHSR